MFTASSRLEQYDSLPASKALELLEHVERWGVSKDELLSRVDITESDLEDPDFRFTCATMLALVNRARDLTGEPGLGFYLGLQKRIENLSSPLLAPFYMRTLREALESHNRTAPVFTTAIDFQLQVQNGAAALIMQGDPKLGGLREYAHLLEYVYFSLLVGLWPLASMLTGRPLQESFDLVIPEPCYFTRFSHLLPSARFSQPVSRIVFDASLLELPIIAPDRKTLKVERQRCQQQLLDLGFGASIVERVRNLLPKTEGFRSLEEVADALHVSPRTLRRQLAEKQVSFSKLLEQGRLEKASQLLRSSNYTLKEVTERIGYSTVPNFVRAFRRWTGSTPAAYRRFASRDRRKPVVYTNRIEQKNLLFPNRIN